MPKRGGRKDEGPIPGIGGPRGRAGAAVTGTRQTYPAKPIRLVLPFAAGSAVDALARVYGQKMTETWKQQVAVDNRTSDP